MHYELYIDVFFMENFAMDFILLVIVRKMMGSSAAYWRICLGAVFGAFLTCLAVALPVPYAFVKLILLHGLVNIAMVRIGIQTKGWQELLRAWLMLYISGFLAGGVFGFLRQYVRAGSLFLALAVASYYVVSGIWSLVVYLGRQSRYRCRVVLSDGGRSVAVQALIDTGNCLKDDITGKPVSIIDKNVIRKLRGENDITGIRYISYHSIGKAEGVMPLVTLDGMYVCRKEKEWVEKPLAAICEGDMTADRYEMILNPDVLIGGIDYGNKSCSTASI